MGRAQVTRCEFDGTQDYVDVTWPEDFAASDFLVGVEIADGQPIVEAEITVDNPGSSRVEPTARFVGAVNVIRIRQV